MIEEKITETLALSDSPRALAVSGAEREPMGAEGEPQADSNLRYGVQGFDTSHAAEQDAKLHITADDFMILHNKKTGDFAWVWPLEYGASLVSDFIVVSKRPAT